jgi:hypothetical protein
MPFLIDVINGLEESVASTIRVEDTEVASYFRRV